MLLGIRPLYVQNLRTAQRMEPVPLNDIREVSHWTFFFSTGAIFISTACLKTHRSVPN